MPILLGTSGWQYKSWKTNFYQDLKQAEWLEFFTRQFATVEVNNAFYRLPERKVFEQWAERTPDDFIVGVKVSRYLTHIKRLKEADEPVSRFVERATGLGAKLGPVLLQLPPNLQIDTESLAHTIELFPASMRVCVEFRHESWYTEEVRRLLEARNIALCWFDSPARQGERWRTSDWGYMRFHEGAGTPHPCYDSEQLEVWADRLIRTWSVDEDVYVYFNNDPNVCAIKDAGLFGQIVERRGRRCSRYPDPTTIQVLND